jgi:hypothetical protein
MAPIQFWRLILILLTSSLTPLPTAADMTTGRPGHGLIGYSITMYKPLCAYTCRASITNPLDCNTASPNPSNPSNSSVGVEAMNMTTTTATKLVRRMSMSHDEPTPECYAINEPFLQTLAYCMLTHCGSDEEVSVWQRERYWAKNVAGREVQQLAPKWTYQAALSRVEDSEQVPNATISPDQMLMAAGLVDEEVYGENWNGYGMFERMEVRHEAYG